MIADYHARAIAETRGGHLVGVVGRSLEKARDFAKKHHAPFWTTDLGELLARPDIQVVCITTPNGAHLDPAVAAAHAGKHLVVEKPIEVTLDRIDAILRAVDEAKVKLAPIFQGRFGKNARLLKTAIDSGRFGRLCLAGAYVKWQRTAEYYKRGWHGKHELDGGGAYMNQAIHAIDLLQWFAGMPSEVFSWSARCVHTEIEGEDTAVATLRFANGSLGTIEASTAVYPGWSQCIEICGENGSARLEDDRLARWEFRKPHADDASILAAQADNTMRSGASAPNAISHDGHRRQIQDLIDALRENRPLAIDGREARKAVALICGLYESAARNAPVSL